MFGGKTGEEEEEGEGGDDGEEEELSRSVSPQLPLVVTVSTA